MMESVEFLSTASFPAVHHSGAGCVESGLRVQEGRKEEAELQMEEKLF
jgi:hypothetical protein